MSVLSEAACFDTWARIALMVVATGLILSLVAMMDDPRE